MDDLVKGIFIREEKTRFLCTVEIDGRKELCYVPSSCKLGKLISLEGETVCLKPIDNKKSDLNYGLFAVKKKQSWVLLNLAEANNVLENQLHRRLFAYLGKRRRIQREKKIQDYKSDIYLPESETVIEIKTVLTEKRIGYFPTIESQRMKAQMSQLLGLFEEGYKIIYLIIALNPATKSIEITDEMKTTFLKCISMGMQCKGYSIRFKDEKPIIYRQIDIIT